MPGEPVTWRQTKQDLTFEDWERAVDQICAQRTGMGYEDLGDFITHRDNYEAGQTPLEFFNGDVTTMLREEHGYQVVNFTND